MQAIVPVSTKFSNVISCTGSVPNMLYTPNNITSTTFTFLVGETSVGRMQPLGDGSGNYYTVTLNTAGDAIPLNPAIFASVGYFQIVTGSTESGSDKVIGIGFIGK